MASGRKSSIRAPLILAAIGLLLIVAWLFVKRDLRGWDGADPSNPTAIIATLPGKPNFTLDDCVPGTVYPHAGPTVEEYSGSATMTVLTCRSRSSALAVILGYLASVGTLILFLRSRSKRT